MSMLLAGSEESSEEEDCIEDESHEEDEISDSEHEKQPSHVGVKSHFSEAAATGSPAISSTSCASLSPQLNRCLRSLPGRKTFWPIRAI